MSILRSGNLGDVDLHGVVRSLFLERATGVLEVAVDGGRRRLFFLEGELYLPPTSPAAEELARGLRHGEGPEVTRELMERMAGVIDGWRDGTFTFDPGRAAVPPAAVGPLPTADLVMAGAVYGRGEEELLARLGGEEAKLVGRPLDDAQGRCGHLEAEDLELLEAVQRPRLVKEVLDARGAERLKALEGLCRLQALELVAPAQEPMVGERHPGPDVLQEFGRRVALDLASRPVELDAQAHRARLAELLRRLGEMSHYQLLGVEPTASGEEIHTAYGELARVVHPLHAGRLGLAGREEGIRLLFERATEAYLAVSDPERRRAYDRDLAPNHGPLPGGEDRSREARRLAEQYYGEAREMVGREEFHYAVELLRQAVHADPRPEYYALMAEVQQRNPKWLHHAADSYRRALQKEPDNVDWRLALAGLFERLGDPHRARGAYRSILSRRPEHHQAKAALARLGERGRRDEGGFFSRLFGRRRSS